MDYFLQLFLSGLTRGSIYALIALGYTMVYGIIQLINFAHGEIYMIGAFTALIVASVLAIMGFSGLSILILAGIAAVIYSSAYGYTMEKIAYRPLRNAPRLSPLISAIGMSIFLQNYVLIAYNEFRGACYHPQQCGDNGSADSVYKVHQNGQSNESHGSGQKNGASSGHRC